MVDLKVFRVRGGQATEIPGASVPVERQLQSLIEASMEATRHPAPGHGVPDWSAPGSGRVARAG